MVLPATGATILPEEPALISIPPTLNLLCGLVVLFPIGTYVLVIARLNRRSRPVLVSGVRDSAGLLLALSGFLFFLWPSLITGFNYWPRDIWLYNHYSSLKGLGHQWWWVWWGFLWLVYLVVVFGGSFLLMWSRRGVTVIYNVEPAVLNSVLERILDRLGPPWTRSQQRILIGHRSLFTRELHREPVPAGPLPVSDGLAAQEADRFAAAVQVTASSAAPEDWREVLEVNPWPALRHVTLHWSSEADNLRYAVDAALRRALAQVRTPENPAGHWLMAASACLFTLLFILTVLFQISRLRGDW
jgi:hypothetical protein